MNKRPLSEKAFQEAKKHLAGGVNSPVRAYRDYDFAPPFIAKAHGSRIWDIDGNEYVDYVGSWGPMILGHAHPEIVGAIRSAAEKGTSYGAPTEGETELAKEIKEIYPSIELVRFVSSGTEATMSAIRVARGFTGRDKIIKFDGCYHGHSDYLLVKAGSGLASFSAPDSSGVPADFAKHTLIATYNDLQSVEALVSSNRGEVAAIIVEPIAGNVGCIPPKAGFLKGLREIADREKIVLIFDEVITGFRVALGGAQELYGVRPDMTCLGKIIGGGLPMGAYGGKKEIMQKLSPLGPVYQAGTLSGNPLAVAAGLATIGELKKGDIYDELNVVTGEFVSSVSKLLSKKGLVHSVNRVGSIFCIFFTDKKVESYADAKTADRKVFDKYFIHMLDNGVYLAPSPFECAFVSTAHTGADFEKTLDRIASLPL